MLDNIRKSKLYLFFLILIIIAVITIVYFNIGKKGKESYTDMFRENRDVLNELSSSLMSLEYELSIYRDSKEIHITLNGKTVGISELSIKEDIKNEIKIAMKDMNLRSIEGTKTYIEFIFNSHKDRHSIVYTINKSELDSYTNIDDLGDNWYYCYIFNE